MAEVVKNWTRSAVKSLSRIDWYRTFLKLFDEYRRLPKLLILEWISGKGPQTKMLLVYIHVPPPPTGRSTDCRRSDRWMGRWVASVHPKGSMTQTHTYVCIHTCMYKQISLCAYLTGSTIILKNIHQLDHRCHNYCHVQQLNTISYSTELLLMVFF